MSRSLSVVLPIYNAQSHLELTIAHLIDVLPELTAEFDILIVDDGSVDDSSDTAQHLVARYPQLRLIRRQRRAGAGSAIAAGVAAARGDVILVCDDSANLDAGDIGKLWKRMGRRQYVQARASEASHAMAARAAAHSAVMATWDRAIAHPFGGARAIAAAKPAAIGYRLFLRALAREINWSMAQPDALLGDLTARGFDCEEISLRMPAAGVAPAQVHPAATIADDKKRVRRPNYLARILALTSGS